jgi:hypothetical protein
VVEQAGIYPAIAIANELRFPDAEFLLWELRTRWKCKSTAGGLQDKGTVLVCNEKLT